MLRTIATVLLCTACPAAIMAQEVELRSSDGFISVDGEIIGFNGTMLSVNTSVGVVSVPASEVACIGDPCLTAIADPSLGLTADSFEEVIASATPAPAPTPSAPPVTPRSDNLSVGFEQAAYGDLFAALTNVFAQAGGQTTVSTSAGGVDLSNDALQQNAALTSVPRGATGNIQLQTASLLGTDNVEYQSPADWSLIGPWTHQLIGLRGFAVVVSPDINISAISVADLAAIYAGEISNWSALGGPDQRILPLQLPANASLRNELIAVLMAPQGKTIANNVLTMADEAAIAGSVQQFPGSISVVSLDGAGANNVIPVSGNCDLPVLPEGFNLVSGDYPLVRPVTATFDGNVTTSVVTELFDFAMNPAAQAVFAADGFVDQTPVVQDPELNNERLAKVLGSELSAAARPAAARMFEVLFDAERLSPTMISGPLSGAEGGWNRAMFVRLANLLAGSDYTGREVFFVGLAESEAGDQAAIDASVQAASEMQAAFGQFAADVISGNNLQLSSYGFGNVAQVTCYDSQISGANGGQVEVWVR